MSNSAASTEATGSLDGDPSTGDGRRRALHWVRVATYSLTALVALSLLTVGTVAVIAEVKGTWHWAIHLESTISYMAVFLGAQLALLAPLLAISLTARLVYDV